MPDVHRVGTSSSSVHDDRIQLCEFARICAQLMLAWDIATLVLQANAELAVWASSSMLMNVPLIRLDTRPLRMWSSVCPGFGYVCRRAEC